MRRLLPLAVILFVTGGTFLVVWFRHTQLTASAEPRSEAEMPRHLISFAFTMAAFLFGGLVLGGFYGISGLWLSADRILFWTALTLTVLLSIAAAVVRTTIVRSGAIECVTLNLLWGMGYGWALPAVMKYIGMVRWPG